MRSSILIFEHILEEEQEEGQDRQEEQEGVLRGGLWLLSKSELLQPATQKRKHRKQLSMIGEILDMDHGMHKMNEEDILSSDSSGGWHDEEEEGKYSKRRRSNVAVIIDGRLFIGSFLFYCLLLNHSFPTNPNRITNC